MVSIASFSFSFSLRENQGRGILQCVVLVTLHGLTEELLLVFLFFFLFLGLLDCDPCNFSPSIYNSCTNDKYIYIC